MSKPHVPYAPEYRRQTVELVHAGRTPGGLAREYECSAPAIRNWVRQGEHDASRREDGLTTTEREGWRRLAAIGAAAGMWLAAGAALAGDVYLRGGIGLDRPGSAAFTDIDCSSTAPAALYGCGSGGDGAPYRSVGDFGTVPAVELAVGYGSGALRFEVLAEYRPRFDFNGHANFLAPERRQSVSAEVSSVSGMLAGFVDFAGLGLPRPGPFEPFVGAGIGAAHTWIGETTMTFPATTTTVPGGNRTDVAWMATAGVALEVSERATLDLAWRYTDLGEIRTDRGAGRVVWRDGRRAPLPLDLAPTRARFAGHGVRVSLRYAF